MREVDRKLIELARATGGKIVTNDYNLNRVAELSGVAVLNINELANALKPVVLPGEPLHVHIVKEGKEADQGVAYLDDGTMVVVEHGKRFIGQTVDVTRDHDLPDRGRPHDLRPPAGRGERAAVTYAIVPAGGLARAWAPADPSSISAWAARPSSWPP